MTLSFAQKSILNQIVLGFFCSVLISCSTPQSLESPGKISPEASRERYIFAPLVPHTQGRVVLVGGCFDLLHAGHILFLQKAKACGDYLVVALEPDERILQSKNRKPVHTQKERARNLAALRSVDHVLELPCLKGFSDYYKFVQDVRPSVIAVTADDPCISNKQRQAKDVGATVKIVTDRVGQLSSTAICKQLKQDVALGCYRNRVQTGKKEARTLGYPTANIHLGSLCPPKPGVYRCDVQVTSHAYKGMCYYDSNRPGVLEAHLFDYQGNLYGKYITVTLEKFVRAPQNFVSLKELQKRLHQDARACR